MTFEEWWAGKSDLPLQEYSAREAWQAACADRDAHVQQAVKDRDMEWWQELALVDNVAPEPKAVKDWLLRLAQYERDAYVQEKVAEARLEEAKFTHDRKFSGSYHKCDSSWPECARLAELRAASPSGDSGGAGDKSEGASREQ